MPIDHYQFRYELPEREVGDQSAIKNRQSEMYLLLVVNVDVLGVYDVVFAARLAAG